MHTTTIATALLAAAAAAAPSAHTIAERDNVSRYNANMDVAHYEDCWNRWVTQLGITGISTNQAESTFTCSR